jgi:SAM-dependent methyltransferase
LRILARRTFPISEELAELSEALGDLAGRLVLDVGCSQGLYARHLALQRSCDVMGLDYSEPFLRSARRRATARGRQVLFVRGLAQHLPLADGSVGAACIGGSLNDIGDQHRAIAELARVMPPGARLFSMSLIRSRRPIGAVAMRALTASGMRFPDEASTVTMFTAAGFAVRSLRLDHIVLRLTLEREA